LNPKASAAAEYGKREADSIRLGMHLVNKIQDTPGSSGSLNPKASAAAEYGKREADSIRLGIHLVNEIQDTPGSSGSLNPKASAAAEYGKREADLQAQYIIVPPGDKALSAQYRNLPFNTSRHATKYSFRHMIHTFASTIPKPILYNK
jgi:hypothetical protein